MKKGRPSLNLNKTLHFSVDEKTSKMFAETSERMSVNRSSVMRNLLLQWLEQNTATAGGK